MLIDTHCHIHDADYPLDVSEVINRAHQASVMQMICVGTDESSSRLAIEFANNHEGIYAAAGVHPHEAKDGTRQLSEIVRFAKKLVAIGEIGLDYHYNYSPRDVQIKVLRYQIELALSRDLPMIFHVREAFDDFWAVLDEFKGGDRPIRGVLHSFTDTQEHADEALKRDLYIGVNGYSTFAKDESQKMMFAALPLDKILFETDAPFLTPNPFRGKVNEPAFVRNIAEFHAAIHHISVDEIANITTTNARTLFRI